MAKRLVLFIMSLYSYLALALWAGASATHDGELPRKTRNLS